MKFIQNEDKIIIRTGLFSQVLGILVLIGISALIGLDKSDSGFFINPASIIFAAPFLLYALIGIKRLGITETVIFKNSDGYIVDRQIITRKIASKKIPTSSITGVLLGLEIRNGRTISQLSLIKGSQTTIDIASKSKPGMRFNGMNLNLLKTKLPLAKEAQAVSVFLNVPLKTVDVSTMQGFFSIVKSVLTRTPVRSHVITTPPIIPDITDRKK